MESFLRDQRQHHKLNQWNNVAGIGETGALRWASLALTRLDFMFEEFVFSLLVLH